MNWIYLSPHFDDIALSCGGLVWEQAQAGNSVSLWTICGGDPPRRALSAYAQILHQRWETGVQATQARRGEDIAACQTLGVPFRHFGFPDCIYRPRRKDIPHYYTSDKAIFGTVHPAERKNMVYRLSNIFRQEIPTGTQLVCPLTLGNHVDHVITRRAAERSGHALWYYPDYPYVLKSAAVLERYRQDGWKAVQFPISESGLRAWQDSVARHTTQINTFWPNLEAMRAAIRDYAQGKVILWRQG